MTNNSAKFVPSPEQGRMFGYGSFDKVVDVLGQAVAAHPYIAGDRFTAADVIVGSQIGWGVQFGTLPKRDAFVGYIERLHARPAFLRAMAADDQLAAERAPA